MREVGVVKKGRERRMENQKGPRKVTKIDASCARNLGTELDLPSVVTLLKGQSMCANVFYVYYLAAFFNYKPIDMLKFFRRKCAAEPLVVEDCWPKKKKRGNGCRKKRSYGETMQTEQNEQDLDVLQNEQQDLDVFQNEDVVQNEQDLDVLQNQDVVQNEQDMDLVPNDYLSADVVQAEPILEVVLPNPVFPKDVVPTKPILEVLLPTELDDIPADAVMKTKSLSELGIVVKRSTDKNKKKKKLKCSELGVVLCYRIKLCVKLYFSYEIVFV